MSTVTTYRFILMCELFMLIIIIIAFLYHNRSKIKDLTLPPVYIIHFMRHKQINNQQKNICHKRKLRHTCTQPHIKKTVENN